jgi:hypothetical protein
MTPERAGRESARRTLPRRLARASSPRDARSARESAIRTQKFTSLAGPRCTSPQRFDDMRLDEGGSPYGEGPYGDRNARRMLTFRRRGVWYVRMGAHLPSGYLAHRPKWTGRSAVRG